VTINRRPDLAAEVRNLKRQVRELQTQRRVANASVDGAQGRFLVIDPNTANVVLLVGDLGDAYVAPDGSRQFGLVLRRGTGEAAFAVYDPLPAVDGFHPYFALYDRAENVIVSDDTTSGQGLARPYIACAFRNVTQSTWPVTTSATFVDAEFAIHNKQHPNIEVWAQYVVDASTAGEAQLVQTSTVIGDPQSLSAGTNWVSWVSPVEGGFGSVTDLHVQFRRTSGTGNVRLIVAGAWGRQS
jgi:hypothetical protein